MPPPPDVGLVTRFVLENPYPLGGGLVVLGLVLGWLGMRDGRSDRLRLAGLPLLVGLAVLATGFAVTTSGERAAAVTRELVDAIVSEDLVAADALFAADARLHVGSERSAGFDLAFIRNRLSWFAERYTVEDNRISSLKAYSEGPDRATVHLACWTDAGGFGPTPSQWVLVVERQDGAFYVTRLIWISVAGREASPPW